MGDDLFSPEFVNLVPHVTTINDLLLLARLYQDVGYESSESFTALMHEKYNIDVNPLEVMRETNEVHFGGQDPAPLKVCVQQILGAMRAEGNNLVGLTISGHFLYPEHVQALKYILIEIDKYCDMAIAENKQIKVIVDD